MNPDDVDLDLLRVLDGQPLGNPRRLRSPTRSGSMAPLAAESDIERMPRAKQSAMDAAQNFVNAADGVARVAVAAARTEDDGASVSGRRFRWPGHNFKFYAG